MRDWRLPENRREAFLRFYDFHLRHRAHPGMVYSWLPAIADYLNAEDNDDQLAWIVWLNGNTQNPVTTFRLLEEAPHPRDWRRAVALVNDHFVDLQWDTDRRYFKSKFGQATERWVQDAPYAAHHWRINGDIGWDATWRYATGQPFMGRLSAWSMIEYARILFGPVVPDAPDMLLGDKAGSRSHRNGLALVDGHDSVYWGAGDTPPEILVDLEMLSDELLEQSQRRWEASDVCACPPPYADCSHAPREPNPHATRLTLESALCTYKSWHKPRRRYPGVYADMAYDRLLWAESRWGQRFEPLWDARERDLPERLRLEDNPYDPGCVPIKQNHYLNTGQPIGMEHDYPDMQSDFAEAVAAGRFGIRKDWDENRWT